MNISKLILFFIFLAKSINCFESDSSDKIDYVVKITSQTGDRAVVEGESIVLLCDIRTTNGNLPLNPGKIQYRWTFNGVNLNVEPRKYNNNNQLIILKTDYSSDLGEYKCIAYVQPTNYPYESQPYSLNIHWISKIARIVHFKYPESDEDIDESSLKPLPIETINQFKTPFKLALKCEANGYPELQIDWYFNNEQIIASNIRLSGSKYSVENNNLYIIGQDNSVSGVYTCSARNSVNSIVSQNNFLIKVKNKRNHLLELKSITSDQIVNKGQNGVILNCEFNNHDKIQWYSPDSNLITNSSRTLISANSSVLTINEIDKGGIYKCVAYRSERKQQLQYSIRVQIAFIDEFAPDSILALYNHPKANNVIIIPERTNKFELLCLTPTAQPDAKIYWLNPENKVISNQGLIRVLDNHQLMFQNARKEFDGIYQCVAENVAGKRIKRFSIKVQKLPLLVNMESHTELTIKEQKNITLNCLESNLTDNQYYTINWYHNGSLINANDKSRLVNMNGQLLINYVNLSHEGLYVCKLNHIGYPTIHNSGFNLKVIELLKFIQLPVDRRLELNRPSKTHCRARTSIDSSNLNIRWIKGDSDLLLKALKLTNQQFSQESIQSNQSESNQEQQHLNLNSNTLKDLKEFLNLNNLTDIKEENGYLIIKQMTKNLSGFYTCLAFTTQELIFTTIRLDAYIMPKFEKTPPEKLIRTVNENLQLDFIVNAEDSNLTVKYDKDNDQSLILNNPRIKTFDNGTLFVFNLTEEDSGMYGIMAANELGFIRAETNLIVKNKIGLKLDLIDTLDQASYNLKIQKTVGIALAVAFLYIVAIIGLLVWYRIKRKNNRLLQNEIIQSQSSTSNSSNNSTGDGANNSNNCTKSNSLDKYSPSEQLELKNSLQIFNQDLNKTSTYLIDDYTQSSSIQDINSIKSIESFNRTNLQQIMLLGNGEYGNVFLAKAIGLNNLNNSMNSPPTTQESMVMVKSLQSTESLIINEFNQEIEMFKNLSHNNISRLMAICNEQEPKLLILEYSDFGDLKQFLLATHLQCNSTTIKPDPLNKMQLLKILIQITDAMNYLSSNNFVHKDLATRNCLISSSLDIKLTLCSLSNDTYSKEYIKFRNRNLPLRWCSYEALFNNEWSIYSDVWSFGVLFWELMFAGELPYFDLKDEQVFNLLKCKQLKLNLNEFDLFSDNLFNLIRQCLNYDLLSRPSFIALNNALVNELNFINT